MSTLKKPTVAGKLASGTLAGLAGTGVMTAFQKLVEMPLTGRRESYAPAHAVERLLRTRTRGRRRRMLNYIAHFGIGAGWGVAFAVAAQRGLHGQRAVVAVFPAFYSADVLLNTAIRVYRPMTWSFQDVVIDVGEKLIQAEATSLIFDNVFAGIRSSAAAAA